MKPLALPDVEPVAWQERQMLSPGRWSKWRECSTPLPGLPLSRTIDGIQHEWRPLYAAPQAPAADALRVLADLVYLKRMKDRLEKLHAMGHGTDWDYYHKQKPIAWANAERIVGAMTASPAEQEKP